MQLKKNLPLFYKETEAALQTTEAYIERTLVSDNDVINEAARYLLKSGGKRLRPGLLLLGGRCGEYNEEKLIPFAAAIEIIHMASLVHDDIVDNAPLRRGKPTIAAKWDANTALFTGNFMLSKALELAASYGDRTLIDTAYATASAMCRGEFAQMRMIDHPDFRTDTYLIRVKRKTAYLISAACEMGGYLCKAETKTQTALRQFGEYIGMAFQITDDILDYQGDEKFGKAAGNDIAEGLATLPLIYAWQDKNNRELIEKVFAKDQKTKAEIDAVIRVVTAAGSDKMATQIAKRYIAKAKKSLSHVTDPKANACFNEIADFIITRNI
jgi:heptaprenyl diphosphate synthase